MAILTFFRRTPLLLLCVLFTACATDAAQELVTAPPLPTERPTSTPRPTLTPTTRLVFAPSPTIAPTVAPSPVPTPTQIPTRVVAPTPPISNTVAVCPQPQTISVADDLTPEGRTAAGDLARFDRYTLDLQLNRGASQISGTQTVSFTNRTGQPLTDLVFHLFPNLDDFAGNLEVSCAAVNNVRITPVYEQRRWVLRLPLEQPIAPDAQALITRAFATRSPRDASERAYGAFNDERGIWSLASFYPLLARWTNNGWDTLEANGWGDYVNSDMSLYAVRITTNQRDGLIVGTGVREGECASDPCTIAFGTGPQRDFAMVQFVGWEQRTAVVGDTTVVSSFPPSQAVAGQRALDLSADAILKFNARFGPYPYREFDIFPIAARTFAGVEYPGLTMIGSSYYENPDDSRLSLQDVVVHEVAHQWWYNVVGNDVLREPWLDEGLTSYSGEYVYTELAGQSLGGITASRQASIERLGLASTPIDLGVIDYGVSRAYVGAIYGKAALFFDALRKEVGDEVFWRILQNHYRHFQFGIATTAGFQQEAERIAGRSLDEFWSRWFRNVGG